MLRALQVQLWMADLTQRLPTHTYCARTRSRQQQRPKANGCFPEQDSQHTSPGDEPDDVQWWPVAFAYVRREVKVSFLGEETTQDAWESRPIVCPTAILGIPRQAAISTQNPNSSYLVWVVTESGKTFYYASLIFWLLSVYNYPDLRNGCVDSYAFSWFLKADGTSKHETWAQSVILFLGCEDVLCRRMLSSTEVNCQFHCIADLLRWSRNLRWQTVTHTDVVCIPSAPISTWPLPLHVTHGCSFTQLAILAINHLAVPTSSNGGQ